MTGKVGRLVFGLLVVIALGTGCTAPRYTTIAQLDPYVGHAPNPIRPLRRPGAGPSRRSARAPSRRPQAWVPARGISPRWECIVIHHSASDQSTPQGMRDWHVNGRGWDALGYHFVIGNGVGYGDGRVYVGERWKKQMHGAHCKTPDNHYNNHGVGICLIGNLDAHGPTAKQVESLGRLISFLSERCNVPMSRVYTHGGVTKKTACPGRYFSLSVVLRRVSRQSFSASSQ